MSKSNKSVGVVETKYFTFAQPPDEIILESGERFGPITVAYETYGKINSNADNAMSGFVIQFISSSTTDKSKDFEKTGTLPAEREHPRYIPSVSPYTTRMFLSLR